MYGGVQSGNICCASRCGTCGGKGCGARPGGPSNCCTSHIPLDQVCGSGQNAPCQIKNFKSIYSVYNLSITLRY